MTYFDLIALVADWPAFLAWAEATDRAYVTRDKDSGAVTGMALPHVAHEANGEALLYLRLTPAQLAQVQGNTAVTVLAGPEPTTGAAPGTLWAAVEAAHGTADWKAAYDRIWPRTPVTDADGNTVTPPFAFGALAAGDVADAVLPELSRYQFEGMLLASGITFAAIEAAIQSSTKIPGAAKPFAISRLRNASSYNRGHPLIAALQADMGLTGDQVDSMWRAALMA